MSYHESVRHAAQKFYAQSLSSTKIAELVGVTSAATIRKWVKEFEWTRFTLWCPVCDTGYEPDPIGDKEFCFIPGCTLFGKRIYKWMISTDAPVSGER